jgi:phage shock protein PspC (stress-responsive transcriptional regulator)
MKQVVTINLNGQAFQLEEPAFALANSYLERARKALAKDPDQTEILADLEQGIADKCQAFVSQHKDVITEAEMQKVLSELGEVEAGEDSKTASGQAGKEEPSRRRLYQVKDGAVLLGVCKGLAVYLNMDVTIVRIIFVVLALLTHGAWIVVYILAALLLPTADSPAKIAAAYGESTTAQDVVDRVRRRATNPETLDAVGSAVSRVARVLCWITAAGLLLAALLLTAAWGVGLVALGLDRLALHGSLAHYNGWPQWLSLTALYLALTVPLLIFFRIFSRLARGRQTSRSALVTEVGLGGVWLVSVVTIVSLIGFSASDFRAYAEAHHGYMDVGTAHFCVDDSRCHPDEPGVRPSQELPAMPPAPLPKVQMQ